LIGKKGVTDGTIDAVNGEKDLLLCEDIESPESEAEMRKIGSSPDVPPGTSFMGAGPPS
jgi:hypothetical protein